ncbi:hypothetical protein CLOHYLEM_06659 [[Clostridium] hylemonae DSM 15053]|uniref:Uncharacterized protein n=1 Tax=[Clostridium] hylemonae DSM 15053 TaxID=553973 RepID=C0C3J7_9FIRM|nr:hypothetical protein CLOHYLEM_06659 [[Clostridium] hylemonae DSM 15053]
MAAYSRVNRDKINPLSPQLSPTLSKLELRVVTGGGKAAGGCGALEGALPIRS